ncbi:MAG: ammonium transporter [Pseudomonadota bacterium]
MTVESLSSNVDILWLVIAAAMVLFMQGGFAALESGLTRAKNSINVAAKNIIDLVVSILMYWLVGYGVMFGASASGLIGTDSFAYNNVNEPATLVFLLFQATFAGTAVTIVSGAVAERMIFSGYALMAVLVSSLVYPIVGHWIWSGDGWLANQGMMDFAGSTVVHSVGAWIGLAGAWLLGPRQGRFNDKKQANKIHGHSLILSVMGVLILTFGWFGFNGGSLLELNADLALVILNTVLAAAAGGIACFCVSSVFSRGLVPVEKLLNGIVGGLVSITASAPWVSPIGAVCLGLIGGVIVYISEEILLHVLKIDDPVNVISAHGVAGVWGTIGLVFFVPEATLTAGGLWAQLGVQLKGVALVFIWSFGMGVLIFGLLKMIGRFRVSSIAENQGLNIHEHGAESTLLSTASSMEKLVQAYETGDVENLDFNIQINIEEGSEGGDIAQLFNRMMKIFAQSFGQVESLSKQLEKSTNSMSQTSNSMQKDTAEQEASFEHINSTLGNLIHSILDIAGRIDSISDVANQANEKASAGAELIGDSQQSLKSLQQVTNSLYEDVNQLKNESTEIEGFLETIRGIAEQTNLLALNAAIEAARAGNQGRGFAVVADEVRTLSQRTQQAAEEIGHRIDSLNKRVGDVASGMGNNINSVEQTETALQETEDQLQSITKFVAQTQQLVEETRTLSEGEQSRIADIESRRKKIIAMAQAARERTGEVELASSELQALAGNLRSVFGSKSSSANTLH